MVEANYIIIKPPVEVRVDWDRARIKGLRLYALGPPDLFSVNIVFGGLTCLGNAELNRVVKAKLEEEIAPKYLPDCSQPEAVVQPPKAFIYCSASEQAGPNGLPLILGFASYPSR